MPADAEMVIEGHVLANVKEVEGPFGEFTGYYGPQRLRNVIEVSAITHRRDAVFQHIFTGHRDTWVLGGIPKEGSLFNLIRGVVPTVKAVHFPDLGRLSLQLLHFHRQESGRRDQTGGTRGAGRL